MGDRLKGTVSRMGAQERRSRPVYLGQEVVWREVMGLDYSLLLTWCSPAHIHSDKPVKRDMVRSILDGGKLCC